MVLTRFRSPRIAALGLALGVAATLADSARAETPKWKFEKGKTLRYKYSEKIHYKFVNFVGGTVETTLSRTADLVWRIDSVDGDKAGITQTVDGVKFVLISPLANVHYDTKAPRNGPRDRFGLFLAGYMDRFAHSKISFTMDSRGAVSEVAPDEKTKQDLVLGPPAMPGPPSPLMDDLRAVIPQTALLLPGKPLREGTSWKQSLTLIESVPFFDKTLDNTFTARGEVKAAGSKVIKITVESAVKLLPKEGATISKTIREQSIAGTILFDSGAGNVSSSRIVEKLTEVVSGKDFEFYRKSDKVRTVTRME